jgi:C-terminal processing protease CtpA/Prc
VVSATPDYASALGTHMVRIGSMAPDQLLAAAAPFIGHENEHWLKVRSTGMMKMLSLLQHVGAADSGDSVQFTLSKPGGDPFTLGISKGEIRVKQVSMFDELHIPVALYRKHLDSFYWYEYLADDQALYVQYNRCENDPKLKFGDFARDLFAFADSHPVKRVVVDLRLNGGGDSRVIGPLKSGLKAREALRSNVYVLIGPGTFSSAQMAGIEFRNDLHATLVGEATGEKLNGYGEVKELKLPNSGLRMQYTTKFFRLAKDDADALEPDLRVSRSLEDALAGRDPVLEAALKK